MSQTEKVEKKVVYADPGRFKGAEYERNEWVLNVPEGITVEDLTVPEFWAHISQQMRPYDHIEARAEDGTWIANLLVLNADRNWAKVHILEKYELTSVKLAFTNDANIIPEWRGPQEKWGVKRVSDGEFLVSKLQTKDEAVVWIKDYENRV